VRFSGLPPGTFPVHLHSVCSGTQAFHMAVLQSLDVNGSGSGEIEVAASDFGRGWCLIVYTNPSLSRVLTFRPI